MSTLPSASIPWTLSTNYIPKTTFDREKYWIPTLYSGTCSVLWALTPCTTLVNGSGSGNITIQCWELNTNLSLHAQGLCIPWLYSRSLQNKHTMLSNVMMGRRESSQNIHKGMKSLGWRWSPTHSWASLTISSTKSPFSSVELHKLHPRANDLSPHPTMRTLVGQPPSTREHQFRPHPKCPRT